MPYGIKLKVWGELAAFNRPEMKVERVSYDVMTPSAARGILEAIYWKPEMSWVIDRIHVFKPIRFTHLRRNEIDCKIPVKGKTGTAMRTGSGALGIDVAAHRQQRAAVVLRDVCYGIAAHVELRRATGSDRQLARPEAKHLEMFKRRANRGQYFHHPYLGVREFPASFELVDSFPPCAEALQEERDLGYMLHDIAFVNDPKGNIIESNAGQRLNAQPRFFRAVMRAGVVVVPPFEQSRA